MEATAISNVILTDLSTLERKYYSVFGNIIFSRLSLFAPHYGCNIVWYRARWCFVLSVVTINNQGTEQENIQLLVFGRLFFLHIARHSSPIKHSLVCPCFRSKLLHLRCRMLWLSESNTIDLISDWEPTRQGSLPYILASAPIVGDLF